MAIFIAVRYSKSIIYDSLLNMSKATFLQRAYNKHGERIALSLLLLKLKACSRLYKNVAFSKAINIVIANMSLGKWLFPLFIGSHIRLPLDS